MDLRLDSISFALLRWGFWRTGLVGALSELSKNDLITIPNESEGRESREKDWQSSQCARYGFATCELNQLVAEGEEFV